MEAKFTGRFRDLKPLGYKFHKLFANNYKVYEKNDIWIWVARGGYVEVGDFYKLSPYVIKVILDDTYPKRGEDSMFRGTVLFPAGSPAPCHIHRDTGEIVPFIKDIFFQPDGTEEYKVLYIQQRWIDELNAIRNMIQIIE